MPGRSVLVSAWFHLGLWILVIFGLSSWPDLGPPDVRVPGSDKIVHAGEYAILGFLFARARLRNASTGRSAAAGAVLGVVVGILDEWYQSGTPGRDSSAYDALADLVGATLGAVAFRVQHVRRAGRAERGTR